MGDGTGIGLELGHRAAVLSAQHTCDAGSPAVSLQVMLFCDIHSEGLHTYIDRIYSNTKLRVYPMRG